MGSGERGARRIQRQAGNRGHDASRGVSAAVDAFAFGLFSRPFFFGFAFFAFFAGGFFTGHFGFGVGG